MSDPQDFALYAVRRLAEDFVRLKCTPDVWFETSRLTWKQSTGLEYAPLLRGAIPPEIVEQAEAFGEVEYELIRIKGDVPRHYHEHSGGAIYILPNRVGDDVKAYLKYESANGDWHSIPPEGQSIELPAKTVHGFSCKNGTCNLLILSVNIPPLHEKDTVYVK